MNYPNELAASALVGEEMKLYHSRTGLKTLSWCVFLSIWLESLFVYFFFISRSMDQTTLYYLFFLAAVFILYLAALVVLSAWRQKNGAGFEIHMIYAAISYFVSAFCAYLFFSAAWRWHFAETAPGASREIFRLVGIWTSVAAVLLLALYAVALLFEPKSDRLIFGNYYQPGLFLPLLPEVCVLLVSAAKQVDEQRTVARLLTPLCIAVLVGFALRYVVKAVLFRFSLFAEETSAPIRLPYSAHAGAPHEKEKTASVVEIADDDEPLSTDTNNDTADAANPDTAEESTRASSNEDTDDDAEIVAGEELASTSTNADTIDTEKNASGEEPSRATADAGTAEAAKPAAALDSGHDEAAAAQRAAAALSAAKKKLSELAKAAAARLRKLSAAKDTAAPSSEAPAAADGPQGAPSDTKKEMSDDPAPIRFSAENTPKAVSEERAEAVSPAETSIPAAAPAPDAESPAAATDEMQAPAQPISPLSEAPDAAPVSDGDSRRAQAMRMIEAAKKRQRIKNLLPAIQQKKEEPVDESKIVFRADK